MTDLSSDRRLHPTSFLFALAAHGRQLLLPGLVVVIAGARGAEWSQIWAMALFVPFAVISIAGTLAVRYRFARDELVIRQGLVFRRERHVPYDRIQNIDGVQNVVHRALGVVDVRIETAGGEEPEAHLSVVSFGAFEELRRSLATVQGGIAPSPAAREAPGSGVEPAPAGAMSGADVGEVLLRLTAGELVRCGLVQGRGLLAIGALFGVLWEAGLVDRASEALWGGNTAGAGVVRQILRALFGQGTAPLGKMAGTAAAFVAVLVVTRLFSVAWALVTLHGFTLRRRGEDLRADFGLFTRVAASIPVRRIQSITIHEGPIHRLFGRVSMHVDTAGGVQEEAVQLQRQWLAPIIGRPEAAALIAHIAPASEPLRIAWQPVDVRGVRRERVPALLIAAVVAATFILMLRWWTVAAFGVLALAAEVDARRSVRSLGWCTTAGGIWYRSGWIWRRQTFAPLSKIQAVAVRESPFDRRLQMANLQVDTAGGSSRGHRVDVPYLPRGVAERAAAELLAGARGTAFRW